MHWGVRKDRRVRPSSSEHKKVSELRKRKTHTLTNKQLKSVNERLNLEQNYHRLNPSAIKRGLAATGAILGVVGMGMRIYDITNHPAGKRGSAAVSRMLKKRRTLKAARSASRLNKQLSLF